MTAVPAVTTASVPSQEKEDTKQTSKWVKLPEDILRTICGFFRINDGARFFATCSDLKNKYWDSLLATKVNAPTLSVTSICQSAAKALNRSLATGTENLQMATQLSQTARAQSYQIEDFTLHVRNLNAQSVRDQALITEYYGQVQQLSHEVATLRHQVAQSKKEAELWKTEALSLRNEYEESEDRGRKALKLAADWKKREEAHRKEVEALRLEVQQLKALSSPKPE